MTRYNQQVDMPFAKKSLGQNFLSDKGVLERMVSFIPRGICDLVLEIGTGPGYLTRLLSNTFPFVMTIEKDDRFVEWLDKTGRLPENCHLIHEDVLKVSFASVVKGGGFEQALLVGNLPYNISSQVVFKLCHEQRLIPFALLLFQKEVAERITSPCCSKSYGVLSLAAQHFYDVKKVMDLSPSLFHPRPKVVSSLVRFDRKSEGPQAKDFHNFIQVVKAAFSQRRKKIVNSLAHQLDMGKRQLEQALNQVGIDPASRAENVTLEKYVLLSDYLLECECASEAPSRAAVSKQV